MIKGGSGKKVFFLLELFMNYILLCLFGISSIFLITLLKWRNLLGQKFCGKIDFFKNLGYVEEARMSF
jgi:hypothetical protein